MHMHNIMINKYFIDKINVSVIAKIISQYELKFNVHILLQNTIIKPIIKSVAHGQ